MSDETKPVAVDEMSRLAKELDRTIADYVDEHPAVQEYDVYRAGLSVCLNALMTMTASRLEKTDSRQPLKTFVLDGLYREIEIKRQASYEVIHAALTNRVKLWAEWQAHRMAFVHDKARLDFRDLNFPNRPLTEDEFAAFIGGAQ